LRLLLFSVLSAVLLAGCGYDFFMNKPATRQIVSISSGEKTLSLDGESVVEDDFFALKLRSDFFRGNAEVRFENGQYTIKVRNLPLDESKFQQFEKDIYAIYYAGDYPHRSAVKMFGKTEMKGSTKTVYDTDGYEIYKVRYSNNQIYMLNVLMDYSVVIDIGADSWGQN